MAGAPNFPPNGVLGANQLNSQPIFYDPLTRQPVVFQQQANGPWGAQNNAPMGPARGRSHLNVNLNRGATSTAA